MKIIAVGQRVIEESRYQETRDALDQRWADFLLECGFIALPIPNQPVAAKAILDRVPVAGMLLTGGSDDLRRLSTIDVMLAVAEEKNIPVLGVCHGMQKMQQACGITLESVSGHVTASQTIAIDGVKNNVNSYHDYGSRQSVPELEVWAVAEDGVIKAIRHKTRKWLGMMWHPERMEPFAQRDINYFREWFA